MKKSRTLRDLPRGQYARIKGCAKAAYEAIRKKAKTPEELVAMLYRAEQAFSTGLLFGRLKDGPLSWVKVRKRRNKRNR